MRDAIANLIAKLLDEITAHGSEGRDRFAVYCVRTSQGLVPGAFASRRSRKSSSIKKRQNYKRTNRYLVSARCEGRPVALRAAPSGSRLIGGWGMSEAAKLLNARPEVMVRGPISEQMQSFACICHRNKSSAESSLVKKRGLQVRQPQFATRTLVSTTAVTWQHLSWAALPLRPPKVRWLGRWLRSKCQAT